MPVNLPLEVHATAVHRKASSACCSAKLQRPAQADAPHEYECTSCQRPTERVLGEPQEIELSSVRGDA
jgi:hypothetical protein